MPFPADRLADRTVAEEKRSPAPRKKGRKRIEGQREMLLLIPGKKGRGSVFGELDFWLAHEKGPGQETGAK